MAEREGEEASRELRMLYHLEMQTLENLRRGQWTVLFYVLLMDLLILVAVRPLIGEDDLLKPLLISVFSLLVLVFALWFLAATRRTLSQLRHRLLEITGSFSEPFRRLNPAAEPGELHRDEAPLLIFLAGVLITGWFITNLVMYELEPVTVFILLAFAVYVWLVSIISLLSAS